MTLRGSLTGAVALAALMSAAQAADMRPVLKAPPPEQMQATGYVEVYTGWANTVVDEQCGRNSMCEGGSRFDETGWVLGGAGRGNYWINQGMSLQVDAQAEGTSYKDGYNGHFSTQSYLVGGHLSWRNPQQSLYGVFAGAGDAGGTRHGVIGAEAQWYWNQFTLYAQGGYNSTLGTVGGNVDSVNAWFLRGTGRYFINPNFMLEGTGMFASGDVDRIVGASRGFDTWLWEAKAEYRMAASPISLFAKYQGSRTEFDTEGGADLKVKDNRVLFGLKLNMGDRNLQTTDRAGATLDIISPLGSGAGVLVNP